MEKETTRLSERKCEACNEQTPPLRGEMLREYHDRLGSGWELVGEHHLQKSFRFRNFRQALDFTNLVGEMSEEEGHHPEIVLSWGRCDLKVYTHAIDALSMNDFIWAAKAQEIFDSLQMQK